MSAQDANPVKKPRFLLSYTLQNQGSVARDHLALERTFLAYMRTSLSISSIGVALTQLFRLATQNQRPTLQCMPQTLPGASGVQIPFTSPDCPQGSAFVDLLQEPFWRHFRYAKPLGGLWIVAAMLLTVFGFWRFLAVQSALVEGVFKPARLSILITSFIVASIVVGSFVIVIFIQ